MTAAKMERLGISTGADLARWSQGELEAHFGSAGRWYWRIARGIDEREVKSHRRHKSVSAERTFNEDLSADDALLAELERVAGFAWQRIERAQVRGRTVTLKVKFGDFTQITRSQSSTVPIGDAEAFRETGRALLVKLFPVPKGVRLLGLGLHGIVEDDESAPEQLGLAI